MNDHMDKLLTQALMIEENGAKEAGALGYAARVLVLATMPHSRPEQLSFQRSNGKFKLTMMAHPDYGLPYGTMARLILAYVSTEAVQNRSPFVSLGESMADFMRELDLIPSGGDRGSITYLKEHTRRLFTTSVSFTYDDDNAWATMGFQIATQANLWWQPQDASSSDVLESTVQLSERFYEELIRHPVPIDMRALKALRRSPLAIDIYNWLTYRFYKLNRAIIIPWQSLELQFGAEYSRSNNFRRSFLKHLKQVKAVYPQAQAQPIPRKGLKLWPSPTHVTPLQ